MRKLAFALLWLLPALAQAQAWPSKPIKLIVPFPAGGGTDFIGRLAAKQLSDRLGQPVYVDNRGGANGSIGVQAMMLSAPDGYTLGAISDGPTVINPVLYEKNPYHPLRDFLPVAQMIKFPSMLTANPSVPAKSVAELIALAKRKPGVLNYGSAGPASLAHLAGALFATMTDVQLTHVPYKSTAQSVIDMMSGRLDMQFATIPPSIQTIRAGQLRALAVTGRQRVDALPDTPTMVEAGVPGYDATLWFALVAPAKFPASLAGRLNHEVAEVLNAADMKDLLAQQGLIAEAGPPEALTGQVRGDITKWRDVIARTGITVE
jgi:tripartite-type tricarboxylate transporter receptor subunit TctC